MTLEIICGPMFSGKTTEFIKRIKRVQRVGNLIQVFKPKLDTRFGENKILSHEKVDLESETGIKIQELNAEFFIKSYSPTSEKYVIAIDEVQFLNEIPLKREISNLLNNGNRVICAGLDMDSFGNPFGSMPWLLAQAENIKKLKAVCVICKKDANMTYRKTDDTRLTLIGAEDIFEARCRTCWLNGIHF